MSKDIFYTMLKSIRKSSIVVLISVAVSLFMLLTSTSIAQSQPIVGQDRATPSTASGVQNIANNVCKGVLSADTGNFPENATLESCQETTEGSFGFIAKRIINLFSIVVGVVSVIMIIIGGFRYIISGGDSSSVQGAKNTILYAIVGLVIVVFAQVIIRFVLTNVTATAG